MEKHEIFARNLEAIRIYKGQSISELAGEIGVPKSTLQSVRISGNTTLDTAMRIADGLGLSLDSLVSDDLLVQKISTTQYLLQAVEWFQALSDSEQEEVSAHFHGILEVLHR